MLCYFSLLQTNKITSWQLGKNWVIIPMPTLFQLDQYTWDDIPCSSSQNFSLSQITLNYSQLWLLNQPSIFSRQIHQDSSRIKRSSWICTGFGTQGGFSNLISCSSRLRAEAYVKCLHIPGLEIFSHTFKQISFHPWGRKELKVKSLKLSCYTNFSLSVTGQAPRPF